MAMAPIPRENLSLGPSYQGGSSNSSSLQEFPQDFEQNLVPVEISWKQPSWKPLPESVFLESSFDGWSQRHELRRVNNEFTMLRLLAPGVYQFKFIVDGEWQVSPNFARIYDPQGNLNNVLYVEEMGKVEDAPAPFPKGPGDKPSSSPPDSYTSPLAIPEDFVKEPPLMPPQLKLSLLNLSPAARVQPQPHHPPTYPRPQLVTLNHTYSMDDMMPGVKVLGCTRRYRGKCVSSVYYHPSSLPTSPKAGQ
mmetsp:Transcript_3557/g.12787  ORF Transcript_3557/g.12787 Transcript_3557/m.12787 type:complete len:249 (-) Transcript_3557:96-842(-)